MDAGKLKELRGKVEERQKKLHDAFVEAGPDVDMSKVKAFEGDEAAKIKAIGALNAELNELVAEKQPLEDEYTVIEEAKRHAEEAGTKGDPVPRGEKGRKQDREAEQKQIGDLIVEATDGSPIGLKDREIDLKGFGVKTLFATSAGWAPFSPRTGKVVDYATRPIQVTDLIPTGETSAPVIKYMEETTFTNEAKEVAEGEAKPEAALALTERESPVRKIAVWIAVTDEQLEDVPQVQSYLNNRLPFMVRQRLDSQILNGSGSGQQLTGFLNKSGVQTEAKGANPTPDAIFNALVKVRVAGRANPSGIVIHPADWAQIRLLRTEQGMYIWGNPSEAGPERIWGLPIAQADAITENTALVGDFANFSELPIRTGMSVAVSEHHASFFVENKQAVRAEMRAGLVIYRPTAFCTVTGI